MAVRAAGLIIYRLMSGRAEYLLMQSSIGEHHWTPPKGHVDPGETDWVAAIRETREEAGYKEADLEVVKDFKIELNYKVRNKDKVVTYWLAKLLDPLKEVQLSHEHQEFRWLPLQEACVLANFDDMQNALRQCEEKISSF
jgi:bis(5'-nucleosidyl)-tetraphosphatase